MLAGRVAVQFYNADKRIQQKATKSGARRRTSLHALQFLPDSPDVARNASDGSRGHRSRLGFGGSHGFASEMRQ
jgi:hypothetical protein